MSPVRTPVVLQQDPSLTAAINLLGPDSYTAHRLVRLPSSTTEKTLTDREQQHADAEHLHLTSRRCFIGPIPEGWLKSHRKQWYKHYLGIHHSSRAPSFSAGSNVGSHRRVTGLEQQPANPSFPQPADADADDVVDDDDPEAEASTDVPPAVDVTRAGHSSSLDVLRERSESNPDVPISDSAPQVSDVLKPDATAQSQDTKPSKRKSLGLQREQSATSYETAHETLGELHPDPVEEEDPEEPTAAPTTPPKTSRDSTDRGGPSSPTSTRNSTVNPGSLDLSPQSIDLAGSTTSLLENGDTRKSNDLPSTSPRKSVLRRPEGPRSRKPVDVNAVGNQASLQPKNRIDTKVQFDLPDISSRRAELQVRARMAQVGIRHKGRSLTRGRLKDGEIVKMEKMLLRIDLASGPEQPEADFTEKDSQSLETRVLEKWREFMVVCRECDDDQAALTLQMYQTRVIPATNQSKVRKRFKHEILLNRDQVRINLYSSLDKTIAICTKEGPRTKIHFLRTRSGTSAVEWFHFLRQILGLKRSKIIQVNIPDLDASIRLENPFDRMMGSDDLQKAAQGDEMALVKVAQSESAVAQNIIDRCLDILSKGDEWADVLNAWANHDHIGLAWRRYDRLEWIHGEAEHKMYGANAMMRSHQLELRSKQHYPQTTKTRKGKTLPEPVPVEGFLIRLTSQKGVHRRMGKFFFKRLYFASHNQFLLFLRPAKARPPPPPKMPMTQNSAVPSTEQLSGKIPLIYAVNPFPLKGGQISWLSEMRSPSTVTHDTDAEDESARNMDMMHNCDGFINLCDVIKVRKFTEGAEAVDEVADDGSDVDFDQSVHDSRRPDGSTTEVDKDRTFELILRNKLVIRLQAFNSATKEEWIKRLRDLARYWRHRSAADMELFRFVRSENLRSLNIDERAEAYVGQFAQKWEITKSFGSPELYHMCGISSCRAVHNAGVLYRKPRVHATFNRCYVILCSGHLIIFQDTLRSQSGKRVAHIHHERIASIDLKDCYLYSGLITQDDLLYQNRTFDSNAPGSNALPRMFLEDSWTSTDEDAMTTFVIWHSQRKGWFRSQEVDDVKNKNASEETGTRSRLRRVNQLGVKGRSVVFKARSRAERDHWVLSIGAEIEKAARDDGVRVVGGDAKEGE